MHRKIGDTNELMNDFIWKETYSLPTTGDATFDKPWLFESNSCTCSISEQLMTDFTKDLWLHDDTASYMIPYN